MLRLPSRFAAMILPFALLFSQRSWRQAEVLLVGAIMAPGRRTVSSILRIVGLQQERRFVNYHRVLNRAVWSPHAASRLLLGLLIRAFAPDGPVVLGDRRHHRTPPRQADRRQGHLPRSGALQPRTLRQGVRPALAQSDAVGASALGWADLGFAVPHRAGALRAGCRERGKRHKKLTDWARQLVLQARRWLPGRKVVLVGDSGFAALELLAALGRHGIICITRLRLDAALYDPAPPRRPGTIGRPRTKGARLPTLSNVLSSSDTGWQRMMVPGWYGEGERLVEVCSATAVWCHAGLPIVPIRWVLVRDPLGRFEPQALLCTSPDHTPEQVLRWFIQRWQLEVTFQETRTHLGVETQRQWSNRAIARTTPCLLALFSLVTLLAAQLRPDERRAVASSAWYRKPSPTFSDTLAAVRRHIWREQGLLMSRRNRNATKPHPALQNALAYAICHAA
jgi:hypothetical protein